MGFEDILANTQAQRKTVNVQSVVDVRLLASLHASLSAEGVQMEPTASGLVRQALERYFVELRAAKRVVGFLRVGEAIEYLQKYGIVFREYSGTRTRYTKMSIVEAVAQESSDVFEEEVPLGVDPRVLKATEMAAEQYRQSLERSEADLGILSANADSIEELTSGRIKNAPKKSEDSNATQE